MNIDDRVAFYMALLRGEPVTPAEQSEVEAAGSHRGIKTLSDAVTLSVAAARMAEDEARRERLDVIRRQLADGSYKISGKDIADKMLNVLKG